VKFPGVYTEAEEKALRAVVREEVQAALASAGQPSRSWSDAERFLSERFQFGDDWEVTALKIEGQWIEISRLIHIFENCSMHAGFIYDQLRKENAVPSDDVNLQIAKVGRRHSAMRKAVTMRDSCAQMARLLKGEDLDIDPDEEITGANRGY
jgi:hypothetical protein